MFKAAGKQFHIYSLKKPAGWFVALCNYFIWQIEWRKKGEITMNYNS